MDCAYHWFRTCAKASFESLSDVRCADTHDNQTGVREGNLYFELNRMLRERGVEDRLAMLKVRARVRVRSRWAAPPCSKQRAQHNVGRLEREYEEGLAMAHALA